MTGTVPVQFSQAGISRFFDDRKIDAFQVADISVLAAPKGRHPRDLLPSCRTIIVFGIVMPDRFFFGTEQEQAEVTRHLKESLESAAFALKELLEREGSPSLAILPSLPLKVEDAKLRGRLSLKHCAADTGFGSIGDNSLLIHPEYGNRLALAAVITGTEIEPSPLPAYLPACSHCNRCGAACPAGAIRGGAFEVFACRNMTDYIPRLLTPVVRWAMRGKWRAGIATTVLNLAGSLVEIRATCTACMTACPYFNNRER